MNNIKYFNEFINEELKHLPPPSDEESEVIFKKMEPQKALEWSIKGKSQKYIEKALKKGAELNEELCEKLYEIAKEEPVKSEIKKMLKLIFKDQEVLVRVGDNYEWSDGNIGGLSYSNFNHYINDIGYELYSQNPLLLNDYDEFKKQVLYSYASIEGSNLRKGEKFRDFEYDPDDEFSW